MERLGMAAIAQAVKMAKLTAQRANFHEHKAVIVDDMDRVQRCAIALTTQLILARGLGAAVHTRGLEEKLVASLSGAFEECTPLQEATELLIRSAADYSNKMAVLVDHCSKSGTDPFDVRADGYEQTHKLARAAIVFTMQLTVACSTDRSAASVNAHGMEQLLVAALDAMFVTPEDVS
jgi:hypothetical protein